MTNDILSAEEFYKELSGFVVGDDMSYLGNCTALIRERDQQLRTSSDALADALRLAELWLLNCVPTFEIEGPKPLPVIRQALAAYEATK